MSGGSNNPCDGLLSTNFGISITRTRCDSNYNVSVPKSDRLLAQISAHRGDADPVVEYVLEAAPLSNDGVGGAISRIVQRIPRTPDYLGEISDMIECWRLQRCGQLEQFASRLVEMGEDLTLRTYSEAKLTFLRDTADCIDQPSKRIEQRLRIANLLLDLARFQECEAEHRLALDEAMDLDDKRILALASNDLAQLLHETNRLAEAEPLMRRALDLDEFVLGKNHPTAARDLNNLSALLQATNQFDEAEKMVRRALQIDEAAFGKHHSTFSRSLNNLAHILVVTRRFEEAEAVLRQALEVDEANLGKQHPSVAIRLNNLAGLFCEMNRLSEAEPLMLQALQIDEAAFGAHHPAIARDQNNLAHLLMETDRYDEAERRFRRALKIDEETFDGQHPTIANRLNNLAQLLKDTGRIEEAEPLMHRAVDILRAFQMQTGCEHPNFQLAEHNYQSIRQAMSLSD